MRRLDDAKSYCSQTTTAERILIVVVVVVVVFLALLVALLCLNKQKYNLLKEENSQLKDELKQIQGIVGNLKIIQNDTSELAIRVAHLVKKMDGGETGFSHLKEDNIQLKDDLKQLQILVGNLKINQNATRELEIRMARMEEELNEIQRPATTETTTPLECPDGFTDMETGCYKVSTEKMSFGAAVAYCASFGSHLSYITSAEEQGAVEEYINNNSVDYRTWIGAYDRFGDDTMFWLDGSAVENGYTNWGPDEPDGGSHDCLYLWNERNWRWADQARKQLYYALCEIDT